MPELDLIKYLMSTVGLQFFEHTLGMPPKKDESIITEPFDEVPIEIEKIIIAMLIQKENIQLHEPRREITLILEMIKSILSTFLTTIAENGTIILKPDDLLIAVDDESWDPLEHPISLPNPEHYVLGASSYAFDYEYDEEEGSEDDKPSVDVDG